MSAAKKSSAASTPAARLATTLAGSAIVYALLALTLMFLLLGQPASFIYVSF